MLLVTSRIWVPSERRKDFLNAAKRIVGPTRVKTGCISCRFYAQMEQPEVILLLEEWETRQAFDAHVDSEEYQIILSLVDLSVHPPEIKLNTVDKTEGLKAITQVLSVD